MDISSYRKNVHVSIISSTTDLGNRTSDRDDCSSRTLTNTEDFIQQTSSLGFQPRRDSSLNRTPSVPTPCKHRPTIATGETIRRQYDDLFNERISEQHQRHFREYFGSDISTKTFTAIEFCCMLQIGSTLGKRISMIFNLDQAYETNAISGSDIIRIARLLWNAPMSVKAFILFKLFDSNGNDKVSIDEIRFFYENYLLEFKVFQDQAKHNEVVGTFLQGFFAINNDIQQQELNFDQFHEILQRNPSVLRSLYLIGIPDHDKEDEKEFMWYQRWSMYMKNNATRIVPIILYILSLISLAMYVIISRALVSQDSSVWQIFAHIGGIWIAFNYAVVIILMLKQTMTLIRRIRYLRLIIPVDDHIDAHRQAGIMLFISAMIHSFGHIIHFATHTDNHSWVESMFTTAAELGWVHYSAPITGDILFVLLIIMVIFSLQCIRQRPGCYQIFYYTHWLMLPMFILLIIHSANFWKWTIGPMSLLTIEKLYLLKRYLPNYGRTRLISVRIEDDKVITLIIERPKHVTFHTGDYINICIPYIARNEWHSFTISSGCEQNEIRLTIMKKKNWTRKVYEHFYARLQKQDNADDLTEVVIDNTSDHSASNSRNILLSKEIQLSVGEQDAIVCIEGPFSSCMSYMFDCEHVVLIGSGIGITPSISALETLIYQLKKKRCICVQCNAVNYTQSESSRQKLKKVDFIWVNRDIGNFSWFHNTLDEFEKEQEAYLNAISSNINNSQEQQSRYLDIHLYCTSLRRDEQPMLGHFPYSLIDNMYGVMKQQDMHTQLRTPTRVGRPPWKLLFAKFKAQHQTTNVIFTGNATMGDEIKDYCIEYGFSFRREPGS